MAGTTSVALEELDGPDRDRVWTELVAAHGGAVWRVIGSRCRDPHLAEDIYQEFWLRLPAAVARFSPTGADPERSARAWLLRVAYAITIDELRKRRSTARRFAGDVGEQEAPMAPEDHDRVEQAAQVQAALNDLPETYRRPVLLHLVGELSYEDLAADLRCTVNNARVRVHRGLQRLRAALGRAGATMSTETMARLMIPLGLGVLPPVVSAAGLASAAATGGSPTAATASATTIGGGAASGGGVLAVCSGLGVASLVVGAITVSIITTPPHPEPIMPMPSTVAVTVLATAAFGAVTPIDHFERADHGMIGAGNRVSAELSLVAAPAGQGSGKALRIAWPEPHGLWVDCAYRAPVPVEVFTAEAACEVHLSLWMEAHAGVRYLAVRFIDAQGEIFEWRSGAPEPVDQSGWRALRIPVSAATPTGHWSGKDPDGVVTFPVRFSGYALAFTNAEIPSGAVIIDDVGIVQVQP